MTLFKAVSCENEKVLTFLIHGCFLHPWFVFPGLSTPRIVHPPDCPPQELSTSFVDVGRWWPPGANCWFQLLKKCLKRESNPSSPVFQASMQTIRPWMVGWVGLIRACGAAATCVWSAYSLHPSHFDCLCRVRDPTHMHEWR